MMLPTLQCFQHWCVPFSRGFQPVTFLRNAASTCMYYSAEAFSQSLFCGTLHEHVCTIQRWLTASHFSAERCMNMYVLFSGGQSLFCGTLHERVCTIQQRLSATFLWNAASTCMYHSAVASHFSVEHCMNMYVPFSGG